MSFIPGADRWSESVIRARLDFLNTCAFRGRELSGILARRENERESFAQDFPRERPRSPEVPGAVESWSEAAALAFATNNTLRGLQFLRSAARASDLPHTDLAGWTRASLYGALTRDLFIRVFSDSLAILPPHSTDRVDFQSRFTQLGTTVQVSRTLPILILAALMCGTPEAYGPILFETERREAPLTARLAAFASPACRTLGLFDLSLTDEGFRFERGAPEASVNSAGGALLEMEANYDIRLQVLQRDVFHWSVARSRAELIDWRLLALYVALIRNRRRDTLGDSHQQGPAVTFLRAVAAEIGGRT